FKGENYFQNVRAVYKTVNEHKKNLTKSHVSPIGTIETKEYFAKVYGIEKITKISLAVFDLERIEKCYIALTLSSIFQEIAFQSTAATTFFYNVRERKCELSDKIRDWMRENSDELKEIRSLSLRGRHLCYLPEEIKCLTCVTSIDVR